MSISTYYDAETIALSTSLAADASGSREGYSRAVEQETLAARYSRMAEESPDRRGVDLALRFLDLLFSASFLLISLPLVVLIVPVILISSGRPIFYRGKRVGRSGRVFSMLKFRTLKPNAESRLGPYLGPELVERTRAEFTPIGRWLRATQLLSLIHI